MGVIRGGPVVAGDVFYTRTSRYICRSCRESFLKSQVLDQQKRHASNDLPFTEKIRRKIWGTDNPPGLKDPYGGPSFLERAMDRKASRTIPNESTTLLERDDQNSMQEPRKRTADMSARRASIPIEQYTPAETWDGLDHIGTTGGWRNLPVADEDIPASWRDRYVSSESFSVRRIDFASLACNMHQAIVESLACKASESSEPTFHYPREQMPSFREIRIILSEENTLSGLGFDSETNEVAFHKHLSDARFSSELSTASEYEQVVDATEDESIRIDPTGVEREAVIPCYNPDDPSFLQARFNFEDRVTFTILKRFSGLSSLVIPDPILSSIMSGNKPISHLLHQLANSARPKPKTLAERLAKSEELVNQSNVMVLPRRETPVDKEKEMGRWKVIEQELIDRGLPVLGNAR